MVIAYTDGSAIINEPKYGGFGVYIISEDGEEFFFKKGFKGTKTGRMEIMAIITVLRKVSKDRYLVIYSDSSYCVNCFQKRWLSIWEKRLWVGVRNVDLLKIMLEEYRKFVNPPQICHVKGHTLNEDIHSLGNAIADNLANYKNQVCYSEDIH